MIEWLKNIDAKLLLLINGHHSPLMDFIMYWASNKLAWTPLYIVFAFLFYKRMGMGIWKLLLSVAVLILLSDQLSVLIKDAVMRYRPCHNLFLQSKIILLNRYCGGLYGFVSSHAANSSALALFLIFVSGKKIKGLAVLLFAYCLLIACSRIYLGAHYPSDVIGGWMLGFLLAWIVFYFYEKIAAG